MSGAGRRFQTSPVSQYPRWGNLADWSLVSPGLANVAKWFAGAAVAIGLAIAAGDLVAQNRLGGWETPIGASAVALAATGLILSIIGAWVGYLTFARWWRNRGEVTSNRTRPHIDLRDPKVGTERNSGAVVQTKTTRPDSTFVLGPAQRVWAEHPMAFCVVQVVNDPPGRSPEALARDVFAELVYDEVLPSGELSRFRHPDHGVWYSPPHLGTTAEEREVARFRELRPNGDAHRLILARYNGEGMYAAFPGSFKHTGSRLEPWVIEDQWQLDGDEFKVTVTIRGTNVTDVVRAYRLVPDELQGIIVEEWNDAVSLVPLRRGRGQLMWHLTEWDRLKNRRRDDPALSSYGKAVVADFDDIAQAIRNLGLTDSVSDLLSSAPDWSEWVKVERTQLPGRLEAAIDEIERLIADQES